MKQNAKGIQNNGIWNHTAKGYWGNKPLYNSPNLTFWLSFINCNIFVKTICPIRKYTKSNQSSCM